MIFFLYLIFYIKKATSEANSYGAMEAAYNFYETKMNQIVVDGGPALDINTLAGRQLECFKEAIKVVSKVF